MERLLFEVQIGARSSAARRRALMKWLILDRDRHSREGPQTTASDPLAITVRGMQAVRYYAIANDVDVVARLLDSAARRRSLTIPTNEEALWRRANSADIISADGQRRTMYGEVGATCDRLVSDANTPEMLVLLWLYGASLPGANDGSVFIRILKLGFQSYAHSGSLLERCVRRLGIGVDAPAIGRFALLPIVAGNLAPRPYSMLPDTIGDACSLVRLLISLGASLADSITPSGNNIMQILAAGTYGHLAPLPSTGDDKRWASSDVPKPDMCRQMMQTVLSSSIDRRTRLLNRLQDTLDYALIPDLRLLVAEYYDWSPQHLHLFALHANIHMQAAAVAAAAADTTLPSTPTFTCNFNTLRV